MYYFNAASKTKVVKSSKGVIFCRETVGAPVLVFATGRVKSGGDREEIMVVVSFQR